MQKFVLWTGIISMVLTTWAMFLPAGTPIQPYIFLFGALVLWWVAKVSKQEVFMALQIVIAIGVMLSFQPLMPMLWRYLFMVVAVGISIAWLNVEPDQRNWKIDWVGVMGLSLIAIGLATPAGLYPMWFYVFVVAGGSTMVVASLINIYHGFKLGWLWVVLNLAFICNPIFQLHRMFFNGA